MTKNANDKTVVRDWDQQTIDALKFIIAKGIFGVQTVNIFEQESLELGEDCDNVEIVWEKRQRGCMVG